MALEFRLHRRQLGHYRVPLARMAATWAARTRGAALGSNLYRTFWSSFPLRSRRAWKLPSVVLSLQTLSWH